MKGVEVVSPSRLWTGNVTQQSNHLYAVLVLQSFCCVFVTEGQLLPAEKYLHGGTIHFIASHLLRYATFLQRSASLSRG
jgi:hypothetical protein